MGRRNSQAIVRLIQMVVIEGVWNEGLPVMPWVVDPGMLSQELSRDCAVIGRKVLRLGVVV